MLSALIVSQILLWGVVVVLGLTCLALVRQVGVFHERLAPAGALAINQKFKAGDKAPTLPVETLAGRLLAVGAATDGRSTLLFFLAPNCPVCKTLLPALKSARRDERAWLDIVLASDGAADAHRAFIAKEGLEDFTYVLSEPLGRAFAVAKLPYAVLIDEGGTIAALGLVNSREHLESLFEAKERGVASIQDYLKRRADAHEHTPDDKGVIHGAL